MRFAPLSIAGARLVRTDVHVDVRGSFARLFSADEFAAEGLPAVMVQTNLSRNVRRGTVRGLHFQWPPSAEGKLVRCVRGRLHDVLLDLRPDSPTYLRHEAVRLDESDSDAVFIPPGVAHGFQTLADDTDVLYQMSDVYAPDLASGVRWNDPAFGIRWPEAATVIADRDAGYPDFDADRFAREFRERQGRETRR
jgi:dTDP-4-dehydrorhamnose 3,5-epimerase